jgi:primary-amine oxidase
MFCRLCAASLCIAVSAMLSTVAQAQPTGHPLDPLSRQEHFAVLEVLQQAGKLTEATRFTRLEVKTPDKASVWAWKPGTAVTRSAEVVISQGTGVFEATVDITGKRLVSWTERKGVQPMWLESEFGSEVVDKAMKDPRFEDALRKRGITNTQFVTCIAVPPGNFGEPKYAGKRVGVLSCRQRSGYRNTWARRIEGLVVVMDMHAKEILEFSDDDTVPVVPGGNDFDRAAVGTLREHAAPLDIRQPAGPGYKLEGHVVSWDRWRFHVRPDSRVGVVISTATWKQGERERPVMFEGHLSEIFVPYMSPQKDWYVRTFIDAGEFSAGGLADSLSPGVDCPDYATYIDSVVPEGAGWPQDKPRVACIFERSGGDMIWRHGGEGRPQRELVVRMIAMIGNYDYVVDWRFLPDGQIKVALGATGIVETKMASARDARVPSTNGPSSRADAYGRFVEDHVVAVNHDHYFNFRLDMDVDGATNRVVRDEIVARTLPANHPRRSIWVTETKPVDTEQAGQLTMDMHKPALWRVTSQQENHVGYPTSYQLLPAHSIHTMLAPDEVARQRAGFINHHLWVTPYAADERYAAGDYPTLSTPGQGLPAYTKGNRSVASTDVVLWYTFGMHHMVRAEEWPVMPLLWHEFVLRPFDFHDRNPAMDAAMKP